MHRSRHTGMESHVSPEAKERAHVTWTSTSDFRRLADVRCTRSRMRRVAQSEA